MPSRREFLTALAAGIALPRVTHGWTSSWPAAADQANGQRLTGPLGLQLWSVREYLPKDLRGTLTKVRSLGFEEVEGAGLWKHTAAELRAAMDAAGLKCQSAHIPYERLRDDPNGAFDEVKALGATWVVCPWIPHNGDTFTREDAIKAADTFNTVSAAAEKAGLHFGYHCHGYEFVASTEGTLFDTLAGATDASRVMFQIDVFHAFLGGADPAQLIDRYKSRVKSLHLKDLKKGFPVKTGTAIAPAEADVPIGTGQLDMPATIAAAIRAGTQLYYVEDESADPWGHIPQSLSYLQRYR
jgi:sugar phosphate isomerase/epimerase